MKPVIRIILIILFIPVVVGCWFVMLFPMMISLYRHLNKMVLRDIDATKEYMDFKKAR